MTQTIERITSATSSPYKLILDIAGMKCGGCVRVVEHCIAQSPGVIQTHINLMTETAFVECDGAANIDISALTQKLTETGFSARLRQDSRIAESLQATTIAASRQATHQNIGRLAIAGSLILLSGLGHLDHVGWIHLSSLANLWYHWGLATLALLVPGRSIFIEGWKGIRHGAPNMNTLVGLGTLTAYLTSCIALVMPTLGWECFFDEPVMLVGFILLGRALEQQAKNQALSALQALIALQPRIARLVTNASEQLLQTEEHPLAVDEAQSAQLFQGIVEIAVERVKAGEWLQVLPGDAIPVDGEILWGQTTVDESMLTGEATPVLKQPGDWLSAGTLNQSSVVLVRTLRTGQDTTLAQIIARVEEAQTRKAPVQKLADTVAGYFTYAVMTIALFTFCFWYGIGTRIWPDVLVFTPHTLSSVLGFSTHHAIVTATSPLLLSIKLAIAVLVVSCPCALGLATPTAILVGTAMGAEQGLLIRGGDVLEHIHRLDTVVFDKTGTITVGQPTVTDCYVVNSKPLGDLRTDQQSADRMIQLAAMVERGTHHPLGQAIQQQAIARQLPLLDADNFHTQPGLGVSASIDQQPVLVGNQAWLQQHHVILTPEIEDLARTIATGGKTVIYVAVAGTVVGLLGVTDLLRPESADTVATLQQMGLTIRLLTGDRADTAHLTAHSIGLTPTQVMAEVHPEAKANAIAQLQAQGHQVAMVGDGINDAPALAQANVGIALHTGTDVARETAAIVLVGDRLDGIVASIQLSRAIFNKIRQNLFWAFAYNIIGIPLAAGVFLPTWGLSLSPAAAGVMMSFSSIGVITNSLALRRLRLTNAARSTSKSSLDY
jgi:P-type Cu2+ transporter